MKAKINLFELALCGLFVTCSASMSEAQGRLRQVNLPGSVAGGVILCRDPLDAGFDLKPGCRMTYANDETPVQVLYADGQIAAVRIGGERRYGMVNHVVVNHVRGRVSLRSFLLGKLPPR